MRRAARIVCTLLDQSNSHPAEISIFAFVISISAWTTRPVSPTSLPTRLLVDLAFLPTHHITLSLRWPL